MASHAASTITARLTPFEQLRLGREILRVEGRALERLAEHLSKPFCEALQLLDQTTGSVIVTGMGKAGLVGQKIMATLAATGTRSHYLHPAEAFHGDLGRMHPSDVILALSFSGETEEVTRLLPAIQSLSCPLIAVTGHARSTLGRAARVVLDLGHLEEACALGLTPSTSTTAMLALGDALALVLSRMHGFRPEDFARYHPGGSLGRKLAKVEDVMRPLETCRVAVDATSVRDVLVQASRPGRRSGAVMLTDAEGRLTGIFTDSDLARLLEQRDDALDVSISQVMTSAPATVGNGSLLREAVEVLAERKISELPVVDPQNRPLGLLDITDVLPLADGKKWAVDCHQPTCPPQVAVFPNSGDKRSRT